MNEVKRKIGGTQISRIFGLSRWGGPMEAYLSLTGIIDDEVNSEAAFWGKEAQPAILRRYNKETGRNMVLCDITYQHPQYEFITFTPDCLELDNHKDISNWPKSNHIVELKQSTIREQYGEPGTDEVSDETALQCQLYMGCCGAHTCDVAVHFLRPRHDFAIFPLKFSQEIFDNIIEKAREFYYEHVIPQIPPPLDAGEGSKKLLNHLYPRDFLDLLPATAEMERLTQLLKTSEEARDKALDDLILVQNLIKQDIGDHQGIVSSIGRITWRKSKDREVTDWKAAFNYLADDFTGDINKTSKQIIIDKYTTITPGARVFRPYWKKEN